MAIGTMAAIGLAAAAGGSVLSASSQKKAASKAADTSLQVASQNNALAQNIYGQNQQALSPYMQRGNAAGEQMNALLGLGGAANSNQALPTQQPMQQQAMGGQNALMASKPWLSSGFGGSGVQFAEPQMGYTPQQGTMPPQSGFGGQTAQQAAGNAFDIFRNSTGYQFRLGEGMNALNSGYAGAGVLQSGDALIKANEYGQNFASNEFGNYMGYLGNQQGVGLGGASALAGVGQNYVNTISNNNNNAGTAQANAQLVAGQNNPFANALGMAGGFLMGR
jgi:hypothetical protein